MGCSRAVVIPMNAQLSARNRHRVKKSLGETARIDLSSPLNAEGDPANRTIGGQLARPKRPRMRARGGDEMTSVPGKVVQRPVPRSRNSRLRGNGRSLPCPLNCLVIEQILREELRLPTSELQTLVSVPPKPVGASTLSAMRNPLAPVDTRGPYQNFLCSPSRKVRPIMLPPL